MKRREFITLLGGAAATAGPAAAISQAQPKVFHLGTLRAAAEQPARRDPAEGLEQRGYTWPPSIQGTTYSIERQENRG